MDILVTGASGVVGVEICAELARTGRRAVQVARRPPGSRGWVAWHMGGEAPPSELRRPWDVIIHTAASTRWTMTRAEATAANIEPLRAVLDLAGRHTHLVHVSTAYVERPEGAEVPDGFDGYRNGYEWSKAACERLLDDWTDGTTAIVRPPLVLGRSVDGAIARFGGPYTLLQALMSGMAPVIVGDPAGYAEIAPVDLVARAVVAAAMSPDGHDPIEIVAAGDRCLRLGEVVEVIFGTVNAWRAGEGLPAVHPPPKIALDTWHRFFLPLARTHLSEVQLEAVQLMGMFEAYTSMARPFRPTWQVADPREVIARSVEYWIASKPRLARRTPQPWSLVSPAAVDA